MLELKSVEHLMLSESGGEKPELITADPIQKTILYSTFRFYTRSSQNLL